MEIINVSFLYINGKFIGNLCQFSTTWFVEIVFIFIIIRNFLKVGNLDYKKQNSLCMYRVDVP